MHKKRYSIAGSFEIISKLALLCWKLCFVENRLITLRDICECANYFVTSFVTRPECPVNLRHCSPQPKTSQNLYAVDFGWDDKSEAEISLASYWQCCHFNFILSVSESRLLKPTYCIAWNEFPFSYFICLNLQFKNGAFKE